MYISRIEIENFRKFGENEKKLVLFLQQGLTAIVGENDEGKSAIIDALRFVLGTKDQYYHRIDESDFHKAENGDIANEARIQVKFTDLKKKEHGQFIEYLTHEDNGDLNFYVNWVATRNEGRKWASVSSGKNADGPALEQETRSLLLATYLRPLRDAGSEMSAGRNSRLSQVLSSIGDVVNTVDKDGKDLLTVSDEVFEKIQQHPALETTKSKLNRMLQEVSFENDVLSGEILVKQDVEEKTRLRQLLEKLNLDLRDANTSESQNRGLGSNNLLFMGCEMLLLESAKEELPLMLIEEPEAHLHPQRQLVVIDYLQNQARNNDIQVIVTTHSPLITSVIELGNVVILKDGAAFPLARGFTRLGQEDYKFLERFLDSTKANLFFAKGVVLVEGDAENILIPVLAKLIGKDFTKHGVSIVNIGHTGLGRYARVFQRTNVDELLNIPVACLPDTDILPANAPDVLGLNTDNNRRRWKYLGELEPDGLEHRKAQIRAKTEGQKVMSFPSELWTLEYDLARSGLFNEMWAASSMAQKSDNYNPWDAIYEIAKLIDDGVSYEDRCIHLYSRFLDSETEYARGKTKVSKTITAQFLANILTENYSDKREQLRELLPEYIVDAIDYVTSSEQDDDN